MRLNLLGAWTYSYADSFLLMLLSTSSLPPSPRLLFLLLLLPSSSLLSQFSFVLHEHSWCHTFFNPHNYLSPLSLLIIHLSSFSHLHSVTAVGASHKIRLN